MVFTRLRRWFSRLLLPQSLREDRSLTPYPFPNEIKLALSSIAITANLIVSCTDDDERVRLESSMLNAIKDLRGRAQFYFDKSKEAGVEDLCIRKLIKSCDRILSGLDVDYYDLFIHRP